MKERKVTMTLEIVSDVPVNVLRATRNLRLIVVHKGEAHDAKITQAGVNVIESA